MKILNTTFYIRPSLHDDFMQWMKAYVDAIPAEISHELDLITSPADEEAEAYALRLMAESDRTIAAWHDGPAAELRSELGAKFGDKALHFTTLMKRIEI